MSWLNFNESLNSIKGQLSSFASGVLADGLVNEIEDDVHAKNNIILESQEEIRSLEQNVKNGTANSWTWEPPGEPTPIKNKLDHDLQKKIDLLENENRELMTSLEQLDFDHQQATAELMKLKDTLRSDHNDLKSDYEKLQREYGDVLNENMEKTKTIDALNGANDDRTSLEKCRLAEEKLSDVRRENAALLQKFESVDRENRELKNEHERTMRRENENRDYEEIRAKYRILADDYETLRNRREDDERPDLQNEIARLTRQLESSARENVELKGAQGKMNEENETLRATLEDRQEIMENVEALRSENRRAKEDYDKVIEEKEALHEKYINIITENMQNHLDSNDLTLSAIGADEQPHVLEFAGKVETLLKLLLDFKSKTESLEKELCETAQEKNKVVAEKNFEIEKLLQNSEILSQEVITKTQTIKDYEEECAELMKNNDVLIGELQNYKNTSGLQTISESNEDNMLLLESQLESANKRVQDLELIINDFENSKQDVNVEVQTELEYIKKQLNMTGLELNQSKEQHHELLSRYNQLEDDKLNLKSSLDKARNDYENIEYKYTEVNVTMESAKEENENYKAKLNDLEAANFALEEKIGTLRGAVDDLNGKLTREGSDGRREIEELTRANAEHRKTIEQLQWELLEATDSKNELIFVATTKHQESEMYHQEIQRLNQALIAEKEASQQNEAIEKLTDQNGFLREKCEVLAQNLLQEQSNVQKVATERAASVDKEQTMAKELERLRAHLVEIEEMYTQELLNAEHRNKEMQAKVNEIEQREKDSSSIYTSVSIRANQKAETLQTQLQLVTNQRDELRSRISEIEDENNKHVAALTTLEQVLEQFQNARDKDVQRETERVRRQIMVEQGVQQELRNDIGGLRAQLDESKQGLQAAARLSDQLEKCKKQIVNLKDEVASLQELLKKSENKYRELSMQNDVKVEKSLIKNLVIGYVTSNANDQNQILKIIATVLDFNRNESDKVNLNKSQQGGWLNSILHPQSLNANSDMSRQSLSEAFVRFLENESQPKVLPNLLTVKLPPEAGSSRSSGSTTPRQSHLVLNEVVLPTFLDFAKSRSSSSILKDVLKDNT